MSNDVQKEPMLYTRPIRVTNTVYYPSHDGVIARQGRTEALEWYPQYSGWTGAYDHWNTGLSAQIETKVNPLILSGKDRRVYRDGKI